jgi:hypothetical protein
MLDVIKIFFKKLLCRHKNKKFVRNIYGDEINWSGGKRSIWKCADCGEIIFSEHLYRG